MSPDAPVIAMRMLPEYDRGAEVKPRCSESTRSDRFGDDLVQQALVDGAGNRFETAVGLHDHERRLKRHVEAGEHLTRVVVDLGERQPVLVDETLVRLLGAGPCDTDEVDLILILDTCFLDRGGFTVADASSGRPEPERHGTGAVLGTHELAPADQWRRELQRRRCHR